MLTSRLERAYNTNNNAPTHAPGFQIDYPPPPPPTAKLVRNTNPGATGGPPPLGKEVPPPLPPKMYAAPPQNNHNPLAGLSGGSKDSPPPVLYSQPHMMMPKGRMVTGSGFVLGKMGTIMENPSGSGGSGGENINKDVSGTWSAGLSPVDYKASSLLDSHDRFKPERSQRRLVQRMKWSSQSRWGRSLAGDLFSYNMGPSTPLDKEIKSGGFSPQGNNGHPSYYGHISLPPLPVESESRVSSMTIADVSPRLALKKVLILYEHAQYREAASFINRVSVGTFRIILRELPMDVFVEAMPHSLPILEALFAKIYSAEGPRVDLQLLKPEHVIMHMVKFFSRDDNTATQPNRMRKDSIGPFTQGCRKILGVIVVSEPSLLKRMKERAKILDKIVEGMGQHGLVGTMDESLMPLHDALKLEFQRVVETYKGALQKLEELSLSSNKCSTKNVAKGPAPVSSSHQRQLSLR
ncbi:hypothetical protein Fcan01_06856 [Folsomia candida]|uniref:Uncharacterized protein n=2 Tax=Folsomia candida TaxID=158441 RepID=A0A226EJ10_FOLCA|nr:hypothetical protein Fcan01_06856 [Folsomia candida]